MCDANNFTNEQIQEIKKQIRGKAIIAFSGGVDRSAAAVLTAKAIGSIIRVVAVFEIHMDSNAVAIIKPKIMLLALVPTDLIILSAIRL